MTRTGPIFGCGAMLAFAICFIPAAPAQARITRVEIITPPVIAAFRAAGACSAGACRVPISSRTAMRYEGAFVQ